MSRTGDLDRYLDDPQVTRAVRTWARDQNLLAEVPAAPWRRRGGSGALLARLRIARSTPGQKPTDVLLKACSAGSPAREPANHQLAWRDSPDFADRHLFRQLYPPAVMDDGRVLMFLNSSESLTSAVTLGQLPSAALSNGCRATIRMVLDEWNSAATRQPRSSTVRQFLTGELRGVLNRDRSAYTWARGAGFIPDVHDGLDSMAHRFQLDEELSTKVEFLAGRSHGDLHVDNVIVPVSPGGAFDFDDIRLIDLSAFDPMAPLSRDIAALLLSLIFPAVRGGALPSQDPSLADALTSEAPLSADHGTALERLLISVRSEAIGQIENRLHGIFHRQYLLSLIAQSITYTSYDNAGESGRRSYLWLGATAAEAYRSSTNAGGL
ncbi:hypothetical protein ACFY36_03530 [Actinoplanes sp. NPDC000266]